VARAIAGGSSDITAVEINPLISKVVMQQKFPQLSRHLYFRPDLRLHTEDGRSFVRRTDEKFQIIQATLVDTWASTAAGAFALSENNLYTTDAFSDYLTHLTSEGILAFTRWGLDPPRESLRLVSLGMTALAGMGETDARSHFIVAREGSVAGWGAKDTVLISRKPFTAEYIARARRTIEEAVARGGGGWLITWKDEDEIGAELPDPREFRSVPTLKANQIAVYRIAPLRRATAERP